MSVDLLVFGPHPRRPRNRSRRHDRAARRARAYVGLCDLTAGEMGSNGNVEERLAEAKRRARCWARRGARTCAGRIDGSAATRAPGARGRVHPAASTAHGRDSVLVRSAPRSRRGEPRADRSGVQQRPAPVSVGRRGVEGRLDLLLLHQRLGAAVVRRRRLRALRAQARRARLPRQPVSAHRAGAAETRLNTPPTFRQLIESRDAQFGALAGVAWAEGVVVREPVVRSRLFRSGLDEHRHRLLRVGRRQRRRRQRAGQDAGGARPPRPHPEQRHAVQARRLPAGLSFHRVETPTYPLFREPQYLLSLANKIVQVARDERLDIIHAHYAIPHATAAYLARQILGSSQHQRRRRR